jgi:spermidine synthase
MDQKQPATKIKDYIVFSLLLGFITIATQIIILREFLSLFYGNELVIGIIITNWMLLTGLGAWTGKLSERIQSRESFFIIVFVILSIMPLLLTFLAYLFRNLFFVQGTMVNLFQVFYSSFLLLLPFCLVSGFLFTGLSYSLSDRTGKNYISKVYAWESTGSIVGGILFNLVLIWFWESFDSLLFLALFSFVVLLFVALRLGKRSIGIGIFMVLAGLVIVYFLYQPDLKSRKLLYKGQNISYYKATPYGNIVVTETGDQKNFFENNILLFSSNQPIMNEESVHYTMLQHPDPRDVLMLSAGVPGMINEVLKYDIRRVDYVEINPWLIKSLQEFSEIYENPKVNVINLDAREYLETSSKKYDVVLIGVPEPSTVQLNRFYTKEFYTALKHDLNEKGIMSFSISGSSNYLSEETLNLYSSLFKTLEKKFKNIIIIPGRNNYFMASDTNLTYDITGRIEKRKLNTQYVNRYYIQSDLLEKRGKGMVGQLNDKAEINSDFKPYTYSLKIRQWLSHFKFNFWLPLGVFAFIALYFLFYLHPLNRGMFTAGFTGASLEIVLLVSFQIMFGSVFQMVGVIITVFMAGLAFGTYYRQWIVSKLLISNFYKLKYSLAAYSLFIPVLLLTLHSSDIPAFIIQILFGIMMFIAAALVGMIFSMASKLRLKKPVFIASEIYSVDLIGAAIGSFVVSVYLIPWLGLLNVCFLIGGIIALETMISSLQFRKVHC